MDLFICPGFCIWSGPWWGTIRWCMWGWMITSLLTNILSCRICSGLSMWLALSCIFSLPADRSITGCAPFCLQVWPSACWFVPFSLTGRICGCMWIRKEFMQLFGIPGSWGGYLHQCISQHPRLQFLRSSRGGDEQLRPAGKAGMRRGSLFLMVAISLSTVFLKQHSAIDVMGAIVLACMVYSFVYGENYAGSRKPVNRKALGW